MTASVTRLIAHEGRNTCLLVHAKQMCHLPVSIDTIPYIRSSQLLSKRVRMLGVTEKDTTAKSAPSPISPFEKNASKKHLSSRQAQGIQLHGSLYSPREQIQSQTTSTAVHFQNCHTQKCPRTNARKITGLKWIILLTYKPQRKQNALTKSGYSFWNLKLYLYIPPLR